MSQQLQSLIDNAWEERTNFSPKSAPADVREAVASVLEQLNQGTLRVAQKDSGQWVVNQWVKKAVLLSFRLEDNVAVPGGGGMSTTFLPMKLPRRATAGGTTRKPPLAKSSAL